MKLILTQEVNGLGIAGDVVEVKDGYGRNFLLPQGLAMAWTRGGQKQVDQINRARKVRAIRDRDHANELKQTLESAPVRIVARAGEGGRLFGSITTADVAGAVKAAGGVVLDKRKVELASPIKTLGKHKATVQLMPNVVATVAIEVVTE